MGVIKACVISGNNTKRIEGPVYLEILEAII